MTRTSPLRLAPLEDRGPSFLSLHRCVTPRDQEAGVRSAICRARCALLAEQATDGAWRGRQQGDASLAARLLLLDAYLDREDERSPALARAVCAAQCPTGGWSARPGGPANLSISVLAYLALKVSGASAADDQLRAARRVIQRLGGLTEVNRETRFWLALFGQAPGGVAARDAKPLAPLRGVRELHKEGAARRRSWRPIARLRAGRLGAWWTGTRDAVSRALTDRALVGHRNDEGEALDGFIESLVSDSDDGATCELAPGRSPLLDSALALAALVAGGTTAEHPAIRCGACALAEAVLKAPRTTPTLELIAVLDALGAVADPSDQASGLLPPELSVAHDELAGDHNGSWRELVVEAAGCAAEEAVRRRNRDGGWGLARGRSSADVTGWALEVLARAPRPIRLDPAKSIRFLLRAQHADGAWGAAWASGRLFSTARAIAGLAAAGVPTDDPAIEAGANWLLAEQLPSGGWGEPVESPRADAEPSASHTAWAIEGLVAARLASGEACFRGVTHLLDTQHHSGEWREAHFTLTGQSPGGWRRNSLYPCVFALRALSSWTVAERGAAPREDVCIRLHDAATVEA